MIYCDSSFLVPLYVPGDVFAPVAAPMAAQFDDPIPLIDLAELELITRIHRGLGDKTLTATQHGAVLRQISQDLTDGILVRRSLPATEHYAEALRLAKRHAPKLAVRTLDILHIAAARLLRRKTVASFDRRQRELAVAVGMKVLPKTLAAR